MSVYSQGFHDYWKNRLLDLFKRKVGSVDISPLTLDNMLGEIDHLRAELERVKAENDDLEDGLQKVKDWCMAYPLAISSEPDNEVWSLANEILAANGINFSQLNISTMRHVVNGIAQIVQDALPAAPEEGE